jgi:hypothetical protein
VVLGWASSLTRSTRVGLLVMSLGALADAAYHALPVPLAPLAGPAGMHAHGLIFSGMLLVLGGVIGQGMQRQPRRARPRSAPTRTPTGAHGANSKLS